MGATITFFELVKLSSQDITNTSVRSVDEFDWPSQNRNPKQSLDGQFVRRNGGFISKRLDVKNLASYCPFVLEVDFSDGSYDAFRIHQKHAIGYPAHFEHFVKAHDITYERVNPNKLKVTVKNTKEQIYNEHSEKLNTQGESEMKSKHYKAAIEKFKEALRFANHDLTINSIEDNMSQALNKLGEEYFEKGIDLENADIEDESEKAQDYLTKEG